MQLLNGNNMDKDNAEIMSIDEFREACRAGAYTDDDGSAFFGDEENCSRYTCSCSHIVARAGSSIAGYTHIWWMNK